MAVLSVGLALFVAGCGDGEPLSPEAAAGEALFAERVIAPNPGCITCHSLEDDARLTGPSMAGIATRAGSRVTGLSAAEYLRTSILEPDAFVVDGFDDDLMPENWAEVLSEEDLDALVSYLLTLEES